MRVLFSYLLFAVAAVAWSGVVSAEPHAPYVPQAQQASPVSAATASAPTEPTYVIGIGDVLRIGVWREPELSGDAVVRPDGKISLPLINELDVLGLTPEQLRARIAELLSTYVESPTVSVVVAEIHSRQVFITGQVANPGPYPLVGPTNVLQLITMAGGLLEYADRKNIVVVRSSEKRPDGMPWSFVVDYDAMTRRENLKDNLIDLRPGDMVIVK